MKKRLEKKLTAFIVITMMFSASANAQIVYTDVIPDSTMYCTGNCTLNYNLDLNNDSNNDFILTVERVDLYEPPCTETYSSVTASPLNGNAIENILLGPTNYPIPLLFNTVIDSNLLLNQSWQTTGSHLLKKGFWAPCSVFDGFLGPWDSLSDYYLGLRLLHSGQTFYGWVRLRVDVTQPSYASVIIRDYAYNSMPNQPILAGQTTATGIIENSFASSINVFPNPFSIQLTFSIADNEQATVSLYNFIGQQVLQQTIANSTTVNTGQLADGIYFYDLRSNKGTLKTGKLVKQ